MNCRLIRNYQKWVEYNVGIEKYGLELCYEIHNDILDYKGYVHIQIPKGEDIFYPFIDFTYGSWGIENLGVREYEQGVNISMKAGEISLQHSISFNLDQLIPFIKDGTIEIAEGLFIVRSAYRKTKIQKVSKNRRILKNWPICGRATRGMIVTRVI
ncbi:hypothetical protein [Gracilibacillus dipsosauri]|uniref:hypothetical protein n=1 Tax=Gracilibacillus dipsosauri TaxID=178340 RepID=UPI0024099ECD